MRESSFLIQESEQGERLDKFLSGKCEDLSRSYIQKLISESRVIVNGKAEKGSYKIRKNDLIKIIIPEAREPEIKAVEMDLDIIYEDDHIIVINKPPGLPVHPAPGNLENTLVNGLLAYADRLSGINGVKRPGIVHRLDKETSGAIVVAKDDLSHKKLVEEFKERKVLKIYHAIVKGSLPYNEGIIDAPIGRDPRERKKMAVTERNSKEAVSHFRVLERLGDYTYLEVKLETGRTHQIRVHLSYLGHPILGDEKYGRVKKKNRLPVERQLLHAYLLGFNHPCNGEWMEFEAPLPEDFESVLKIIKNT